MFQRGSVSKQWCAHGLERLFFLENHLQSSSNTSCHQLSVSIHPPTLNNRRPEVGFTGIRGHISATGVRIVNSPSVWFLSWMLGLRSCLLERKRYNAADYDTLTTHLALFLQLLQMSEMLTLCLGWFPIFFFFLTSASLWFPLAYLAADPLLPWSYPSMSSCSAFSSFLKSLDLILLTVWPGIGDTAFSPLLGDWPLSCFDLQVPTAGMLDGL